MFRASILTWRSRFPQSDAEGDTVPPNGVAFLFNCLFMGGNPCSGRTFSTEHTWLRSAQLPSVELSRECLISDGADVIADIERLMRDASVTDIVIQGGSGIWLDCGDGFKRCAPCSESSAQQLARELIGMGGRHIDVAHPAVDVRLAGGIRVHAVLAPVSTRGTSISLRIPRASPWHLADHAAAGMFTQRQEDFLRTCVCERKNILIVGATGSGKTALLAALMAEVAQQQRIVTVEDVAELEIDHPHVVSLEVRQANSEGRGAIDMPQLIREALRMRPDRLIVGEARGAEIRELLLAFNTGHAGGASTLHANSLLDVPRRLEALGMLAGLSREATASLVVAAFDEVLFLERQEGKRRLAGRARFVLADRDILGVSDVSRA